AGPQDKLPAKHRLQGYYNAMQQAGLPIRKELVLTSDFEFAGGFSAMQTLLSLPIQPQAVFTCNDAMAVGAYQAIYQKGLRVPDDISIV
ncbi:substrate-binding domain-containing protein, partial [Escherichia coli]